MPGVTDTPAYVSRASRVVPTEMSSVRTPARSRTAILFDVILNPTRPGILVSLPSSNSAGIVTSAPLMELLMVPPITGLGDSKLAFRKPNSNLYY